MIKRDYVIQGIFIKEISPDCNPHYSYPLLMAHGGSHGWWAFEPWMNYFACQGWRTFSVSLRNHTGSYPVSDADYLRLKFMDYVDDLKIAARFISEAPVLIGHSMGGLICQKAAESISARGLVLVGSVGPGQLGAIRDPLPLDKPVKLTFEQTKESWFHHIDNERLKELYKLMVPESTSVINEYSQAKVKIERNLIECPIFVLQGANDATTVHKAEAIADFYHSDHIYIPGAGHDLMLEENYEISARTVSNWLKENIKEDRG